MEDGLRKDLAYLLEDLFLMEEEDEIIAHIHEILLRLRGEYVLLKQRFKILEEINSLIDERAFHCRERALSENSTYIQKRKSTREVDILQLAMASAYTSIFSDNDIQEEGATLDMHDIAVAMHRALYHLSQLQLWHCQLHSPLPDRLWYNIHLVYRESLAYELSNYALVLVTVTGSSKNTIEENYKRCLLLGAANTSVMEFKEIADLYHLLDSWVQQVTIHPQGNRADIYSIFLFSDGGPVYQSLGSPKPRDTETWRTVDTTELVNTLQKLHHQVESRGEEMIKVHDVVLHKRQIHRLLHTWGTLPHRRFKRVSENVPVEVCFNISEDTSPIDNANSISDLYTEPQEWETTNTSPNGYCLSYKGELSFDLHPGQLIKIHEKRESEKGGWHLSQVRWIKCVADHEPPEYMIGVQLLSPTFDIVHFNKNKETGVAILLPEIKPIHQVASIIMPTTYMTGDKVHIMRADGKAEHYTIKLGECIDLTSDFIRYHFKRLQQE